MDDTAEKLKRFVTWCAENAVQESRLLYPHPGVNLDYFGVLDQIVEIFSVPQEQVGAWVDAVVDAKLAAREEDAR